MKKILLIPFLLFAALSMAACGAILMSRSLQNSPNSRKIRVAVMIPTIIPDHACPPAGTGRYLVFMLPARTIPSVWRN